MLNRRNFVRLAGGGVVMAAGAAALAAYSLSPELPGAAVEAWSGPAAGGDVRRRAVAYAITAPNPHNRQPWLVDLREPGVVTLYCDTQRLLPETDPFGRQIMIGHGAFLELLVMALAQEKVGARVTLWPEGELPRELKQWSRLPVARVELTGQVGQTAPDPLFAQVLRRHTAKTRYDTARQVPADMLDALVAAVPVAAGIRAGGTVDATRVQALRALCLDAARTEISTPETAMESVRLLRVGPDEILAHRDGISVNTRIARIAAGLGQLDRSVAPPEGSAAFKQTLQTFDDYSNTAMGFVWLGTARNGRADQIAAGRAYVRLQLHATEVGVGMHPMSQALQEFAAMTPHYTAVHRALLDVPPPRSAEDATVQMMCRIGFPVEPARPAPRRPVANFFTV